MLKFYSLRVFMPIGVGYFSASLLLFIYGGFCFFVGIKRLESLIRITKAKIGAKNKSDDFVAKFCMVWAIFAIISRLIVFAIGFVNTK